MSKEQFEEEFAKFGKIDEFKFNRERNIATIEYARLEDAIQAMRSMNGKDLDGEQIRVDFVRLQPIRRVSSIQISRLLVLPETCCAWIHRSCCVFYSQQISKCEVPRRHGIMWWHKSGMWLSKFEVDAEMSFCVRWTNESEKFIVTEDMASYFPTDELFVILIFVSIYVICA